MPAVKLIKKGKVLQQVECPNCSSRWIEEYKKNKKFKCRHCNSELQFSEK